MRRPQFTLKTLLWLMAVVAVACASGPTVLRRATSIRRMSEMDGSGNAKWINYEWRNGIAITIELPASEEFMTKWPIRLERKASLVD